MKDWYLMNTNHDTVSGFESDDFDNLASDAFEEALASSLGIDVEICNYDLSERTSTRIIVEGNVQDTKLNSIQRRLLARIGTCEAGQYVYYKNRYWLIIGLVDDNGLYEKGVMIVCNHLLTWENQYGDIIQRWVSVLSASQYNNGETTSGREAEMTYRSDQLMVLTPCDDESILIPHGKRFIIDLRCKIYERNFDDGTKVDTSKEVLTYRVTRLDNILYNYEDSGHAEFMAYQDEQHENDGYYVINGKGYWLCDKPIKFDDGEQLVGSTGTCVIECEEPVVYCGFGESIFFARFFDENGNSISANPEWEIKCGYIDSLMVVNVDNSICISADNTKLIGESFELSLHSDGYETTSITVSIKALI